MKVQKFVATVFAVALSFIITQSASYAASLYLFDGHDVTIESTVGSESNEALIFVDWAEGTTRSHAWLFRWDGTMSVGDAYNGIEAATPGFAWSHGNFVSLLDFNDGVDDHKSSRNFYLSFWNSAAFDSTSGFGVADTNSAGITLYTNGRGVFDEILVSGEWYGANANTEKYGTGVFPGPAPEAPVQAVPEPTTVVLLLTALGTVMGTAVIRRKKDITSQKSCSTIS